MGQLRCLHWQAGILTLLALIVSPLATCAWAVHDCEEWVVRVESVEGDVGAQDPDESSWTPVALHDTFCAGIRLRVGEQSRAAVTLRNDTILRLDQNTTIAFALEENRSASFIDLLLGAAHFFSRIPHSLQVNTPYVNALVEGTEFLVRVESDRTSVSTLEGRVAVSNSLGTVAVSAGQASVTMAHQAPMLTASLKPRDAVRWALYFPSVLDPEALLRSSAGSPWQQQITDSLAAFRARDLAGAFAALSPVPEDVPDAPLSLYRATLLLSVGRVEAATAALSRALELDPSNGQAAALQAIVTLVLGDREAALTQAQHATALQPQAAAPWIALSYAQQAHFDIKAARESLAKAVSVESGNALAWARYAELWLSCGERGKALEAAERAAALDPQLARTQTVRGFAHLAQFETGPAKEAFRKAIVLDQSDPMPHLGLGLCQIRDGDLAGGRHEIEVAVTLDPGNSLIRSYLGKAYFDEKRDHLASDQFALARELDPKDPTPWFYEAIQKQTENRPVEALEDLQRSIELNDNRAVYRSRLLLDQDLAARSASLARIYENMGFEQLALVEGWRSLNVDPADYSAHRLLADLYDTLPRHEIARVSELLQSQLLQPLNLTPIQPEMAESEPLIMSGLGPAEAGYSEFNPLFNRNRLSLLASSIGGERSTFGDDLVLSGLWNRFSASVGQFHYETDGYFPHNGFRQDIYDAFTQVALSASTSIQAEYRSKRFTAENLYLYFYPDPLLDDTGERMDNEFTRFGFHHAFSPHSDLIGSFAYRLGNERYSDPFYTAKYDETGYAGEIQHLYHGERFNLITGVGHSRSDLERTDSWSTAEFNTPHMNFYAYSIIRFPSSVAWTLGASADSLDGGYLDRHIDQFNPKFGVSWNPLPNTTIRAAVFRTLKRTLLNDQTIEPTQVAGFNQFYDDGEGTDAWRYGIGVDQKLSRTLFAGMEFSRRDMDVIGRMGPEIIEGSLEELFGRAYLYWTPYPWLAVGPEYQFERFSNNETFMTNGLLSVDTHRVAFQIGAYHPSGFFIQIRPTLVFQDGDFLKPITLMGWPAYLITADDSQFALLDASIGYRFPGRRGIVRLEVRNLCDTDFRFQDTDPTNPTIAPVRTVMLRLTLAF